jgi:hypothetical protein
LESWIVGKLEGIGTAHVITGNPQISGRKDCRCKPGILDVIFEEFTNP